MVFNYFNGVQKNKTLSLMLHSTAHRRILFSQHIRVMQKLFGNFLVRINIKLRQVNGCNAVKATNFMRNCTEICSMYNGIKFYQHPYLNKYQKQIRLII